jgi:23S rRNA (cytosine1962-C5)-methyltransferase
MMSMQHVVLKQGRDKPVRQRHPWIFSGAIARLPADAANGDIVDVMDHGGGWLARGYLNRSSQIQVRLLSWDAGEAIDGTFWRRRMAQAISQRASLTNVTNALRLINAENDYLPGLTVDRFDRWLVMQCGTLAVDQRKQELAAMLLELTGCAGVVERSEASVRKQEGLSSAFGLLAGQIPDQPIEVHEDGLRFLVDMLGGQKTGFYGDQRANRRRVATYCSGKRLLNAFSYTGAFAVYALAAGATHVTNIDSSFDALQMAEANLRTNGFDPEHQTENIAGDVFEVLRDWRYDAQGPRFDVIVLDPPKFAHSQAHIERALRGYKEINMQALHLTSPGGILATFSCSGLVSADLFQKVVFGAAVDAGRQVQILEWLRQDSDHPVAITFPEGEYLKGLICRVL